VSQRSPAAAHRWQRRFDGWIAAAAILAIVGVALQVWAHHGPLHVAGLTLTSASWLIFGLDTAVMVRVSVDPWRWARGHRFELVLLVLTCPLWPVLFYRLLVLELLPALTVLEAAKLAKLVKAVYALKPGPSTPTRGEWWLAGLVLAAALGVATATLLR
jgi:hypothetical protein